MVDSNSNQCVIPDVKLFRQRHAYVNDIYPCSVNVCATPSMRDQVSAKQTICKTALWEFSVTALLN